MNKKTRDKTKNFKDFKEAMEVYKKLASPEEEDSQKKTEQKLTEKDN